MARYIDAEKLKPDAVVFLSGYDEKPSAVYSRERIDNAPTVDVSPVVRCKDCVLHGHCSTEDVFLFSRLKSENAFCCVGKRKEDDNG